METLSEYAASSGATRRAFNATEIEDMSAAGIMGADIQPLITRGETKSSFALSFAKPSNCLSPNPIARNILGLSRLNKFDAMLGCRH